MAMRTHSKISIIAIILILLLSISVLIASIFFNFIFIKVGLGTIILLISILTAPINHAIFFSTPYLLTLICAVAAIECLAFAVVLPTALFVFYIGILVFANIFLATFFKSRYRRHSAIAMPIIYAFITFSLCLIFSSSLQCIASPIIYIWFPPILLISLIPVIYQCKDASHSKVLEMIIPRVIIMLASLCLFKLPLVSLLVPTSIFLGDLIVFAFEQRQRASTILSVNAKGVTNVNHIEIAQGGVTSNSNDGVTNGNNGITNYNDAEIAQGVTSNDNNVVAVAQTVATHISSPRV